MELSAIIETDHELYKQDGFEIAELCWVGTAVKTRGGGDGGVWTQLGFLWLEKSI